MAIDAAKLKDILSLALKQLDKLGDNYPIETVSNTYFLGHPNYFLGIASEGYINLDEIIDGDLGANIDTASILDKLVYLNDESPIIIGILEDIEQIAIEDGFSPEQLDAMEDLETIDELHYYLLDNLSYGAFEEYSELVDERYSDFIRNRH